MSIGTVETRYGKVQGVELEGKYSGITLFKGIPYAAPPVGELRFAAPVPPVSWEGVRICDHYGDAPIQVFADTKAGSVLWTMREFHLEEYPPMSEDCLYLNICTGAKEPGEKRPVYMWYHGGGLVNGYSFEPQFDPSEMAARGIVVVQVGTRLNAFGCLALPQLREEQGTSGNYGLMDQLMALRWIRENIEAFGGDPENITAGGESGGCTKATVLAAIPASKNGVRRVINQSGNMWLRRLISPAQAEEKGRAYLCYLGIDPDTPVSELRKLDAMRLFDPEMPRELLPNDMVQDGVLIPDSIYRMIEDCMGTVDFLNGSNCGEADVFGKQWWEYDHVIDTPDKFRFFYRGLLGRLYDKYDFESLVDLNGEKLWVEARRLASLGLSAAGASNSSRNLTLNLLFGRYMAKRRPDCKVYSYLWSHRPPYREEDVGTYYDPDKMMSFHGSDLWFVFDSLRPGRPPVRPWREEDYRLADQVCQYWCNFIRTGDPNGDGLSCWPPSGENLGYVEFVDEAQGHNGIDGKLGELLMEFNEAVFRDYL